MQTPAPVDADHLWTGLPIVLKEYGTELKKDKKEKGVRYNLELTESAEEWLQDVAEDDTLAL